MRFEVWLTYEPSRGKFLKFQMIGQFSEFLKFYEFSEKNEWAQPLG